MNFTWILIERDDVFVCISILHLRIVLNDAIKVLTLYYIKHINLVIRMLLAKKLNLDFVDLKWTRRVNSLRFPALSFNIATAVTKIVMAPRWKYLPPTLKGLCKHLVAEHNTLRKEWIEKGAYIFTLGDIRYLGGFPSKENAFV